MKGKPMILFLCTGNSCRSQMAEGFARHYGRDRIDANSAGISPVGVNPKAVNVMKEVGIDISGQTSKAREQDMLDQADFIITLCGDARESCPLAPGKVNNRHWPLEDPARAEGTDKEIMDKFRLVRDQILKLVLDLISELNKR